MLQFYNKCHINQVLTQKILENADVFKVLSSNFTKSETAIFNLVIDYNHFFPHLRRSISSIANHWSVRCSERTVQRALKKFTQLGLIMRLQKWSRDLWTININREVYKYAKQFQGKFFRLKQIWKSRVISFLDENVTLTNKSYINNPCIYNLQVEEELKTRTRDLKNLQKQKESRENRLEAGRVVMSEVNNLKISPTLREITTKLNLSKLGQLKLLAFSDETLQKIWVDFQRAPNIKSPFDWLIINCTRYCERNKIKIDWDIFYVLLKRYNQVDDRKYTLPRPKSEPRQIIESPRKYQPKVIDKANFVPPAWLAKEFAQFMENLIQ